MAIRMIRKYFTTKELLQLITSNLYSILFYNSEIWHIPSLNSTLKQKLLAASVKAIKICVKYCTNDVSYIEHHTIHKRATPEKMILYKHALNLFRLYNCNDYNMEWAALNYNQIFTTWQTKFISKKAHTKKVGLNAFANRISIINNRVPLNWFNMSFDTFKVHCKKEFMM